MEEIEEINVCLAWFKLIFSGGVCLLYALLSLTTAVWKVVKDNEFGVIVPLIFFLPLVITLFPVDALYTIGVLSPHDEASALIDRRVYFDYDYVDI